MIDDYPEYIIKHRQNEDGETQYYVKWRGFDVMDNTWETEQKIQTEWPFVLKKYKQDMKAYRAQPQQPNSAIDKVFEYTNAEKDWENAVENITYVEKTKLGNVMVYVKWKNGYKSMHHSSEVSSKCPQKVRYKIIIPHFLLIVIYWAAIGLFREIQTVYTD
ncbi:hypothetical protein INT47_009588 [Mucor saturninus]|uniref:Chromo domain-containing protein n=1 Tax=Mucor saturninus TaxID=64648 RepID=A0A8H7QK49_9FUNG|nr:hypothetical protein INT47_009588 [Mucor saturninus]